MMRKNSDFVMTKEIWPRLVSSSKRREPSMPVVHVNVWEGLGEEKVKTVIEGITKVFVNLDIPEHAVEVIVHEIPKSHWGIGGEPASEKFKDQ
jgi:4-oxalocrotonate tautomerase